MLLKGENLKAATEVPALVQVLDPETLLTWYTETKNDKILDTLLSNLAEKYYDQEDKLVDRILEQYPDKFLVVVKALYKDSRQERQKEWNKTLAQKYPKEELTLDYLVNGNLDKEDVSRVLIEENAQRIFDLLQKRSASGNTRGAEIFATIDLLNACPEFAQKVDPKAAASLLKAEDVHTVVKYSKLPPHIAQKVIEETGLVYHKKRFFDGSTYTSPCSMSKAILARLPLVTAYDILKKQVDGGNLKIDEFYEEMQKLVNECELSDATVEALLKIDFAPSAIGLRRLQTALEADTVSDVSKTKIQAYIEKIRAEALMNEAKAKQERLVIEHCYVSMREIDLLVRPTKGKGITYGTNGSGIVTSFTWTAKQCYDWFGLENDEFRWKFAQKYGLADFKFVSRTERNIFDDYVLVKYWISTTRERGKNVEFLYNDENKKETLTMRGIQ